MRVYLQEFKRFDLFSPKYYLWTGMSLPKFPKHRDDDCLDKHEWRWYSGSFELMNQVFVFTGAYHTYRIYSAEVSIEELLTYNDKYIREWAATQAEIT